MIIYTIEAMQTSAHTCTLDETRPGEHQIDLVSVWAELSKTSLTSIGIHLGR